ERILQDAVLMDASFVRECICAYYSLIGRHGYARDPRKHPARGVQLFKLDVGADDVAILAYVQRHGQFFEGRISGALADAIDRAFDLTDARVDRRQRVRKRE